jgi:uncharacterized membrane protein YkvA (DUF1232 family)
MAKNVTIWSRMSEKLPMKLPSPKQQRRNESRVNEGFWPKIRRHARRIPFVEEAVTAWFCACDPNTPSHIKAVILAALAYLVLPMDAVPDFLPALGFLDDAAMFMAVWKMLSNHITDEHRRMAAEALDAEDLRE